MAEKITLKNLLANLPQKTDVDTVVGRDASGNPVYIKKADLAQVVAELIGINDTWYRWRNNTKVKDFNELKTPGFYQIQKDEDTLNAPPTFGIIEVLTGTEKTTIIQRATDQTGIIHVRGYSSSKGTWSEWTKI